MSVSGTITDSVLSKPYKYWSSTERGRKAEDRLHESHYDVEAWGVLIREAQATSIENGRLLFEKLVTRFPTTGRYWKLYIEQEMKDKSFEQVEKLFQRCLIKVLNIDLWKCYLNYVKETKLELPNFREKMIQAYEFAVDKIGMDYLSYPIWLEYISFLKSGESVGAFAENQKITSVRKAFTRACVLPIHNVDLLWKDYNSFEQGVNKQMSEKLIHDRTRDFMTARRLGREYDKTTSGITRGSPAVPPQGTIEETSQKEKWRKYVEWERKNPLRSDDSSLVVKRVMYAYEQFLLTFGHHPDVWYEASSFLESHQRQAFENGDLQNGQRLADDTSLFYERATATLMQSSLLVHFAYADFEESRKRMSKVKEIYEKIIADIADPTLVYIQYMKACRRAEGIQQSRAVFKKAREDSRCSYHVFTAAALLEHYCNKDAKVSHNIFELGLKRYNEPGYALAYLEHKIHLNDDNNTRVLFEKILSTIEKEESKDILLKYLSFESQYGDLASMFKVDRRLASINDGEYDSLPLVERYRYLDLYPCTSTELKSMSYSGITSTTLQSSIMACTPAPTTNLETAETAKKNDLPKPDISQMKPFKPIPAGTFGLQVAPGGVFPPPPAASLLMAALPPPSSFFGPFVEVDKLLDLIGNCKLDEISRLPDGTLALSNGTAEEDEQDGRGVKRSASKGDDSDEEGGHAPPINDIYRQRQQKRVHVA